MNSISRKATTLIVALSAFVSGQAWSIETATGLDVADKPLVTVISVKPNLIVALDDSGSMSFELSMDGTNDGSLWFDRASNSFVRDDGTFFDNNTGGDSKTSYLFPWTEGPGRGGPHYVVPPFIQYAFARSPNYNRAFYDPAVSYDPWPDVGGFTFDDVPIDDAPFHIIESDAGGGRATRDLNLYQRLWDAGNGDYQFELHHGMVIPAGTRYSTDSTTLTVDAVWGDGQSGTTETDREQDPVEWNPAEVYVVTETGNYAVDGGAPDTSCAAPHDPADYKTFEFAPSDFSGTGDIVALGPDGRCLERIDESSGLDMQNFANWFTYYRKRHLATRNGLVASLGEVRLPLRAGYFTINDRQNVTMREFEADPSAPGDERALLLEDIIEERFGGGTPNRLALNHAGEQFEDAGIIEFACQKNFTMFFTDGFSTLDSPGGIGNLDDEVVTYPGFSNLKISGVEPYADDHSGSFADIAMRYFRDFDVPGGFEPGLVPTPSACRANTVEAVNADCNADLHMNTYVVTLNAQGRFFNNTQGGFTWATVGDAYEQAPAWPDVNGDRDLTQIDDLYHGAVNGRGLMLNAKTPQELRRRFQEALTDIAAKSRSASALAATSTRISTDSRLYQSIYDTETWTGDLVAVDLQGNIVWEASETIDGATRNVFTYDGSARVEFEWDNLDSNSQTAFLNRATSVFGSDLLTAYGDSDTAARALIDYLEGDATGERRNGGILRDRGFFDEDGAFIENPLGDIVNSVPIVMGPRNEGWTRLPAGDGGGDAYRTYVDETKQTGRNPNLSLFVGANAGALQAFNADTGAELFAYVPRMLIGKTAELPHPDYDHEFYVDGTPVIADAFDGGWKTVLVAGLGAGGRGYFALDVTQPSNPQVLWEFSSADDADLGFAIGEAVITRTSDGTWVAIFGNGFGSDGNDGYVFVLDLFDGTVLGKIPTTTGTPSEPAGVASPRVLMNQDDGLSTETLYVGDLQGRMFRIDATGGAASWGQPAGPIFVAEDANGDAQPITAAPTLVRTPEGEVIVYFGTGKFFEPADNVVTSGQQVQSFYAFFDDLGTPAAQRRGGMTEIPLGATVSVEGELVRTLDEVELAETATGWYIDLLVAGEGFGERVIAAPRVRFGRLLFTSFQPVEDVCTPGGIPRLYVLDARSGSPRLLQQVVIDPGDPGAGVDPTLQNAGAVELAAGAPVVPPIAIDTTDDANVDETGGLICPFGRPVFAIDPNNPLNRILLGCLQEGRVNWGERTYED